MQELENWREEKRSAYLYRTLADIEAGTARHGLFLELSQAAEKQSTIWERAIRRKGAHVPASYAPDARTRLVAWLTRRFGPKQMRGVLAAMKVRGMSLYVKGEPGHPRPQVAGATERRHRALAAGGNLRAAVFGVNDGLVSNASLIFGVAGAGTEPGVILISGVAGLLAGAFSMAAGEYVSVRSQREMAEYQIGLERDELAEYPEEEAMELALIYEARGLPRDEARHMGQTMVRDAEKGLDVLAREELGLNPEELGSPWGAALFSFVSFACGALIPLLPFLSGNGTRALFLSVALTAVALFTVGALISLFTGRSAWRGGLRMLGIGATAGGVTFLIGKLLGVTLA